MTRTLTVTLELQVEDLSDDERRDGLSDEDLAELEDEDDEPARVAELEPQEIADLLPYAITSPDNEMFAGSGVYAAIKSATVVSSSWKPEEIL